MVDFLPSAYLNDTYKTSSIIILIIVIMILMMEAAISSLHAASRSSLLALQVVPPTPTPGAFLLPVEGLHRGPLPEFTSWQFAQLTLCGLWEPFHLESVVVEWDV